MHNVKKLGYVCKKVSDAVSLWSIFTFFGFFVDFYRKPNPIPFTISTGLGFRFVCLYNFALKECA
jgi:hypothetical protein